MLDDLMAIIPWIVPSTAFALEIAESTNIAYFYDSTVQGNVCNFEI